MTGWTGGALALFAIFVALLAAGVALGVWALLRRGPRAAGPAALALAAAGLAGSLAVVAAGPGFGHGFMRMMSGGMGAMMGGGQTGRSAAPPAAGVGEIRVVGREFAFDPSEIRVGSGETVNLAFDNRGHMFHTLTVGGTAFELRAESGELISGAFRVDRPGRYSFICTVPGHAELGMRGTIAAS